MTRFLGMAAVAVALTLGSIHLSLLSSAATAGDHAVAAATPDVTVGPQYDTTHVLVPPEDFDRFVGSVLATFGGTASPKQAAVTVTPTLSSTMLQAIFTPVGTFSVFGFTTPVPYPFGAERTGYLVTDMDAAIRAARATGADVVVNPFNDPIGRDAIIQFPGGVNTQLYWHPTAPSYKPLEAIPENRVYVSSDKVAAFVLSFLAFSHGKVVSDDAQAPGVEVGSPGRTYRRIRIESGFGRLTALVTNGQLPFPYGRETIGFEVANLADTLSKAKAAGARILVARYGTVERDAALVQFPGGFIAEIHSHVGK